MAVIPQPAGAWQQRRAGTEQVITGALLATVPADRQGQRDWPTAHPYVRTYLAQHAAAAGPGAFSALVQDADFLAAADPVTLSPLLSFTVPELRDLEPDSVFTLGLVGQAPTPAGPALCPQTLRMSILMTVTVAC